MIPWKTDRELISDIWYSHASSLLSEKSTSQVAQIANDSMIASVFGVANLLDKFHGYNFYAHDIMKVAASELAQRKAKLVEQMGDKEAAEVMFALQIIGE